MCIGGSSPYRECAGVKFARLLSDSPFQAVLSERLRLFSAENIYFVFSCHNPLRKVPRDRKRRRAGGGSDLSTATERAACSLRRNAENPRRVRSFAPQGCGVMLRLVRLFCCTGCSDLSPQGAVIQVHGSVNNFFTSAGRGNSPPGGGVVDPQMVRFSHSQDCESSLRCYLRRRNVPLNAGLARENWFRARYGAVNRAVMRSMAHCRDWVNLLILQRAEVI